MKIYIELSHQVSCFLLIMLMLFIQTILNIVINIVNNEIPFAFGARILPSEVKAC